MPRPVNSRWRGIALLTLLATAGAAGAVRAQAGRDSARADSIRRATALPDLEVRGVRPVLTTGGSAAVRARLDSLPLPPGATLEQTLRQLPMLHLRRNARGEAEISARGSESRQVAVLVDGIPLTLAWDARADVSVLPSTAFQEVSFTRGLSSMLYGPNVLGGVIELPVGHSSIRPERSTAEVQSGVDHVGGFGGSASMMLPIRGATGQWLFRGGVGYRNTPGTPLADGVVEPLPGRDNLRVNTDAKSLDGFTALRYQSVGGTWFSLAATTFKAERGAAAELGFSNARFWRYPEISRTLAIVSAGTGDHRSPFGGRGDLEASFGVDLGKTDIDTYTARDYTTQNGFEDGKDRTLTFRALGDQTLGSRGDLRTAFTVSEIRHDEFLPAGEARYRQRLMSIGAETNWRLIDMGRGINALRLSVGAAYDVGKTPESGGRPKQPTLTELGARIGMTMVAAEGRLLAHAGVSRRGRFPALRELYSGALNRFTPNPDLKPENLVAVEAGITARLGSSSELQLVGFRHQMNDAVVRITLPDNTFQRVNRNRLTSAGVELLGSTVLGPLALGGDLTLQHVDLTNTQASITNRPENLPNVFGGAYLSAPLLLGMFLGAEARYTGNQFCIDPATGDDVKLAGGAVFNGDVGREFRLKAGGGWFSRIEARLSVENLGDKLLYEQCRLPEPGRLLRFQVRLF
jgi:iron complex outermembrane receptor protein